MLCNTIFKQYLQLYNKAHSSIFFTKLRILNIPYWTTICLKSYHYIVAWTKCVAFIRWHFEMYFLEHGCFQFDKNFTQVCFQRSIRHHWFWKWLGRNQMTRHYMILLIIPYLRVYQVVNYVIHHVVLHGGSGSKIYWYYLLFIPQVSTA